MHSLLPSPRHWLVLSALQAEEERGHKQQKVSGVTTNEEAFEANLRRQFIFAALIWYTELLFWSGEMHMPLEEVCLHVAEV